jgi:single-strand DNA-binding protein
MLNLFCSSFSLTSAQVRPRSATFVGSNLLSPYLAQEYRHSIALKVMSDEDDIDEERLSNEELQGAMGEWDDKIARFNTVHLVGRIGGDPEPKYFDDGKVVLNLSLACKRKYHSMERKANNVASGEEETDWYGLEIWGQTAEFVSKYVDKGARVGVIGSLQVDQWTDKASGEPRSRAKVVVRDFDLLETKAEADLRRSSRRGPAFYKDKSDDDEGGGGGGRGYGGGPSSAGSGGFFD